MASDRLADGVNRTVPSLAIHKVAANLQFHEHGLQPYWGAVSALEPGEDDEELGGFEALGHEWHIHSSTYWNGKIADPQGRFDDGLYEYRYQLVAEDEIGDRDATIALRPGYPETEHVDSGERIQSIPADLPECLRVEVQTTNVGLDDVLPLLRAFFEFVGLNPEYISEPAEWSRIWGLEGYVRVDRDESAFHITGDGGIIQDLAQFGSSKGDRGEHKWDHEDVQGHYEAVALDADTWGMLLPEQQYAKRLKSYHPEHVRSEDGDRDDPLYHPKLEVQLWQDEEASLPWDRRHEAFREFQVAAANALQWSGVGLDADSDSFITDGYHPGGWSENEIRVVPNPIPDLEERVETQARDQLLDPAITHSEFDAIEAVADGGSMHYTELAETANVSSSTVYRLVNKVGILEADGGLIRFPDQVTRERVRNMVKRFSERFENLSRNLRDVVDGLGRLTGDSDEPSALERWMDAHGAVLANHVDELHFEFPGRAFTEHEIVEILRSGYRHAVEAGLESQFRDAKVTYKERGGDHRKMWDILVQRNGRDTVLRGWPLRETPTA